jgi:mono/diheme cytochrome c family protein
MVNRVWYVIAGAVVVGMAAAVVILAATRPGGPIGLGGVAPGPRPASFSSDGESVYYTGRDAGGKRIAFSGGPSWLTMHGGSCVDCHGADGRGGKYVMAGTAVPPDIRYSALAAEEEGMDSPPYTDATIKRAIVKGFDPGDHPLDLTMPRWDMSERDLNDVISYLKQLSKGKEAQ